MPVEAKQNGYGVRWFRCGSIKIVLSKDGKLDVGHARTGGSIRIEGPDIDDLDEVLTYVQRVRKEGTAPLVVGDWRDAAADMIRAGRDAEACLEIAENSLVVGPSPAAEAVIYFDYHRAVEAFIDQLMIDGSWASATHDLGLTWTALLEARAVKLGRQAKKMLAAVAADPTPRCKKCNWPLAASADQGCIEGNCSYRKKAPGEQ